MKPRIFAVAILVLGGVLTACSAVSSGSATESGAAEALNSSALDTQYDGALSIEQQLAFGIIKLDGSANEVSSETAAALLPLWKAARSLDTSQAVSAAEVQAVYRQIQETMNQAQLEAIAAMQLTSADVSDLGVNVGAIGAGPDQSLQATAQAGGADGAAFAADMGGEMPAGGDVGGMPAGGMNMGGGMPGGGGGSPAGGGSSSASSSARTATQSSTPVLDAVINYLTGQIA